MTVLFPIPRSRNSMFFAIRCYGPALLSKLFVAGKVTTTLLVFIISVITAQAAIAGPHPNMYLNQSEIDAIKSKVSANAEPWASAYSVVMSRANAALNQSPLSVTYQGYSGNQYSTESPYCGWPDGCRDGQINPDADRGDYEAAIKLGDAVRDLGLGYAFTGQARYADKAIELIRVWSLNSDTYMTPSSTPRATTGSGGRIELFITMPGYLYGADLIWNYAGWDPDEKAAFASWVKTLGDHAKANGAGLNNFANWRVVLIASAGALLDDSSLLDFAAAEWKRLVPLQMDGSGKLGWEYERTKGLHYSLYAINAMIQGAEILRHRNVNLYDYKDGVKGLELALDYIVPYAINPASWPYQQITTITQNDSMALFELAYSYYRKPIYLDAINRWTRPLDEIRVMGINTLTHANRFDLVFTPTPPSITTQPNSVTVSEGDSATFSVGASGSATLSYQWFRNGSAIANATGSSYTVTTVSASDNGSIFRCDVTNSLGSVTSEGASLTVLSDTEAPTLTAVAATNDTRIDITFSEPVNPNSAENVANYQVDYGIVVTAANLNADGRTVSLTVSPLAPDTVYTVSVSGVQDMAQNPNTIVAQTSQSFTYLTADGFEDGSADGWSELVASNWSVVEDEGDMAYFLNTSSIVSPGGGRLGEYSLLPGNFGDFRFSVQAKLGDPVSSNAYADYALVFGFQDSENYYYALFNNEQSATQLFKVIGGSRIELATASADWLYDNNYHLVEVNRLGSTISVLFDGNVIMSADDNSLGEGRLGVGSYNDSAYFDDVSITEAMIVAGSAGGSTGGASAGGGSTGGGSTGGGSTGGGSTEGGALSDEQTGGGGVIGSFAGLLLLLVGLRERRRREAVIVRYKV